MNQKLKLFLLVAVGGAATLGSYVWGFAMYPDLQDDFWGGVPENWIPWYTANMPLAALGFLAAFALFLARASTEVLSKLTLPYLLILVPSALWLPLTVWLLHDMQSWLWYAIRIDLLLVGLGGLLLYPPLFRLDIGPALRIPALVIYSFFVLQTAVLDALVWTALFPSP